MSFTVASSLILITTTYYPDLTDIRYQLCLKSIHEAKKLGLTYLLVDSSPNEKVKQDFQAAGGTVVTEKEEERCGKGKDRTKSI